MLLRDSPGWSLKEAGGDGDCGFRACALAMAATQGKVLTLEQAKREGAKLRLYAIAHLRKHATEFQEWFAVDTEEGSQAWAGKPPPQSFDDYVTVLAHAGVWIDNLSLSALAARTGVAIVTWIWDDSTSTWYRSVSAPWYKDQIGQCAKKLVPIVLVLRHKHFRALIPDSSQMSCPSEWLRKTEWRPAAVLRGAGKSVSALPSTPAKSARSVCKLSVLSKTPSRGSGYCGKLSVVSKTPGRSSGPCTTKDRRAPQSVDAASTCSRVTSVQLSSCPRAAVSGRSVGRSSPAQRAPKRRPPSGPSIVVRDKPPPKGLPKLPAVPARPQTEPILWWTCSVPGCGYKVYKKPNLAGHSEYRKTHLQKVHGIASPPSLRGGNDLATKHDRINKQMNSYDRRWELCFQAVVEKGWWQGSHRFDNCGPDAWRQYLVKGEPYWRPLHRCNLCSRLVPRCELTVSPCPNSQGVLKVAAAKRKWKECVAQAKDNLRKEKLQKRPKGLTLKEACRRARAARWGHQLDAPAPAGLS